MQLFDPGSRCAFLFTQFFQLFPKSIRFPEQLLFLYFRIGQIRTRSLLVLFKFMGCFDIVTVFLFCRLDIPGCLILVVPDLPQFHVSRVLVQILLLQFDRQFPDLVTQGISLIAARIDVLFQFFEGRFFAGYRFLQLLDLPASSEQVAGVLKGAACHGTAGTEQLSFQCHDPDLIFVFPGQSDSMIYIVDDQRSSEQP